jgi:competence protein ComEA
MIGFKKYCMLCALLLLVFGISAGGYAKEVEKVIIHKININKAPVEELIKLDRIGKQYAQRIVTYRDKNGPFQKPEDITKVKGIGEKVWEANKGMIVVK